MAGGTVPCFCLANALFPAAHQVSSRLQKRDFGQLVAVSEAQDTEFSKDHLISCRKKFRAPCRLRCRGRSAGHNAFNSSSFQCAITRCARVAEQKGCLLLLLCSGASLTAPPSLAPSVPPTVSRVFLQAMLFASLSASLAVTRYNIPTPLLCRYSLPRPTLSRTSLPQAPHPPAASAAAAPVSARHGQQQQEPEL